jgi:fructokinase
MESTNQMVIVGLGEVLWDMLPDGKKIGGAPANFAYHMSQCDFPTYLVSAVGNDELGEQIRDTLSEAGLNLLLPVVEQPTGTVDVELDS